MLENTRWRKVEEKPKGEEVRFRSGERSEESRSISIENGVKIVGQESFSWLRECILQRKQGMQEGQTEEEEMRQQQRMKIVKEMTREIRAKGIMDANSSWCASDLLAADCEKAWLS